MKVADERVWFVFEEYNVHKLHPILLPLLVIDSVSAESTPLPRYDTRPLRRAGDRGIVGLPYPKPNPKRDRQKSQRKARKANRKR